MFLKTNIPETTGSLDGTLVGFGDTDRPFDRLILNDQPDNIQAKIFGNRCGHDPLNPRHYDRPPHHKPRPSVLEEFIEGVKAFNTSPKKILPHLAFLNPSKRRKRSERREAIVSVAQVLAHYLELITLQVGFNTAAGAFVSLDLPYIAKKADISCIRAKRAIKDLVKAGYIKLAKQVTRKDNGSFVGLPSVREITTSFFEHVGINLHRLFTLREWKRKKEEKKNAKQALKKMREMIQTISSSTTPGTLLKKTSSILSKFSLKKIRPYSLATDRILINQARALYKDNPNIPISEYLKILIHKKEWERKLE